MAGLWKRVAQGGLVLAALLALALPWLWGRAFPELPRSVAPPLPELARALLWVEHGGSPAQPRSLGPARLLVEMVAAFPREALRGDTPRPSRAPQERIALRVVRIFEQRYRGLSELYSLPLALRVARWWTADEALDTIGQHLFYRRDVVGLWEGSWVFYGQPLESLEPSQLAALIVASRSQGERDLAWTAPELLLERTNWLLAEAGEAPVLELAGLMPIPDHAWASVAREPLQCLPEEMDRVQAYCARSVQRLEACGGSRYPGDLLACLKDRVDCRPQDMDLLEQHMDCVQAVPCGEELDCAAFVQRMYWDCPAL
jgi:hypothetical protein